MCGKDIRFGGWPTVGYLQWGLSRFVRKRHSGRNTSAASGKLGGEGVRQRSRTVVRRAPKRGNRDPEQGSICTYRVNVRKIGDDPWPNEKGGSRLAN